MAKSEATTAPAEAVVAPAEKKSGGGIGALLPVIIAVVAAPALTWAVAQFVLIPSLKKELQSSGTEEVHAAEPAGEAKGGHGKAKAVKEGESAGYTFENVVVNLAGTMGTRYLKTTFLVTGSNPGIKEAFEANKAQLVDVTLNVLSSLTLSDLEEAGAKNILREKLLQAYNQALGRKVAEQLFFSDFVVQ